MTLSVYAYVSSSSVLENLAALRFFCHFRKPTTSVSGGQSDDPYSHICAVATVPNFQAATGCLSNRSISSTVIVDFNSALCINNDNNFQAATDSLTNVSNTTIIIVLWYQKLLLLHRMEKTLHCYYQNVRGLRTKTKDFFLASAACNYDLIIITETWLLPSIFDSELFTDSFMVYRCDRFSLTVSTLWVVES